MNRRHGQLTALVLGACAAGTSCTPPGISPGTDGRVHARVVESVDGDTVAVRLGSRTERVRLIGVNTPETVHPTKPVECFGPESSAHTKSLLPPGTDVWLERDVEARDKYGRLLAYVWRAVDGLFVNLDLVSGGWAVPYPFPPNTAHEADFAAAANGAAQQDMGLWGKCPR